jgi:CubicO group peptidase (beta-lactamase class C family)
MISARRQLGFSSVMVCLVAVCHPTDLISQYSPTLPDSQPADRVDALLAQYDRPDAPGLSVGVYRAGEIVYSGAVGMADLEHHVRLSTGSVFEIASMSKQFTAMAVVLLHQDGKLSLDDDIRKFVPELQAGPRTISIRQLLHHTSGIRDYLDVMDLAGDNPESRVVSQDDVLDVVLAQHRLNFDPGDAFRYENSSYALMATLVQRVSGKSLRQFAAERIFGPLGMLSTSYRDDHTNVVENRACGYEARDSGWSAITPISDEVGDGGVWTTVTELARWDGNFYRPSVGGESAIRLLLSQATLNNGLKMSYALGLFVEKYRGFTMVSHGGVDPGYRAQMLRFPDERLTVAVLANNPAYDVESVARRIADIYLPRNVDTLAVAPPASTLAGHGWPQYAGRYLDEATGRVREIVNTDEGLVLRSRGRDFPLLPIGTNRFRDPSNGGLVAFRTKGARVVQLTMSSEGQMPSASRPLPKETAPVRPSDYAGTFASSELGITWHPI